MIRLSFLLACSCFLFLISACKQSPTTTYVYGPTTATGTIVRADVSLVRRGTHTLMMNDSSIYFLESKTVDLRSFEGQTVVISGMLEPNSTDQELPVLVVSAAQRGVGKEDVRTWEIPTLGIRLSSPANWAGTIRNATAIFSLIGEEEPLLTIEWSSGSVLPSGTPLYIRNRRTVEVSSGTLSKDVFILDSDMILKLHFDPTSQQRVRTLEEGEILAGEFEALLSSITFLADEGASVIRTGSGSGSPCGGPAGILCGAGSYCEIVDTVNQVGKCKQR
ncbi:MAG: hypothetical protein PHZ00_06470 [Candidatus Peribacteraceae bacterium]|nr:hypothetical protein [Candidatus Peribacteraceae bacterium]